ncbi:hypothetical protein FUAX_49220 (plasmid) [Fulvitalea axinellae]|uniref:T9SS type A sorting domain-containing protein n=1 Tax=Fulvitalea axinellae TaxID=1182444 RepID=A0AAU9DMS1_9BACT|nr:hypothetical protein FUAX_49220 [Fulvitalea axinellae]
MFAQGASEVLKWKYQSSGTGNWSDESRWLKEDGSPANRVPDANDIVLIDDGEYWSSSGGTIVIDQDAECLRVVSGTHYIIIWPTNRSVTLSISAGVNFVVSDNFTAERSNPDNWLGISMEQNSSFRTGTLDGSGPHLSSFSLKSGTSVEYRPSADMTLPTPTHQDGNKAYESLTIHPTSDATVSIQEELHVYDTFGTNGSLTLALGTNRMNIWDDWEGESKLVSSDAGGALAFKGNAHQTVGQKHRISRLSLEKNRKNKKLTFLDSLTITKELQLVKGKLVTNGKTRLFADENGYAIVPKIDNTSKVSVNGDIIVDRYFRRHGVSDRPSAWYRFGPVVTGATLQKWKDEFEIVVRNGTSNVRSFSEKLFGDNRNVDSSIKYWQNITDLSGNLAPGSGLAVYLYNSEIKDGIFSFSEKGTLAIGDIEVATSLSDSPLTYGFNMLSNPYACPVSWKSLLQAQSTPSDWDNVAYVWDTQSGTYRMLVGQGGNSSSIDDNINNYGDRFNVTDDKIGPGQAFLVYRWAFGAGQTFRFSESAKVTDNDVPQYRRGSSSEADDQVVNIVLDDNKGHFSAMMLHFGNGYTKDFRRNEDVKGFGGARVSLVSVTEGTPRGAKTKVQTVVNNMPYPQGDSTVALGMSVSKTGMHKLVFRRTENLKNSQAVHVYDKYLDVLVDTKPVKEYSFEVSKDPDSWQPDRFEVRLSKLDVVDGIDLSSPESMVTGQGRTVEVPVSVSGFSDVREFSLELEWEAPALDFKEMEIALDGELELNKSEVATGKLGILWKSNDGENINCPDGDDLFKLKFSVLDSAPENAELRIVGGTAKALTSISKKEGEASIDLDNTKFTIRRITPFQASVDNDKLDIIWDWSLNGEKQESVSGTFGAKPLVGEHLAVKATVNAETDEMPSVKDLILLRRHLLGISGLTNGASVYAGDMNGDGKLTTKDIADIRSEILGSGAKGEWEAIPSEELKKARVGLISEVDTVFEKIVGTEAQTVDFTAIRKGKVDNNTQSRTGTEPLNISYGSVEIDQDGLIAVPLVFEGGEEVIGAQFSLAWEKDVFDLLQVDNNREGLLDYRLEDGKLSLVWNESYETTHGENLVTLRFRSKQQKNRKIPEVTLDTESVNPLVVFNDLSSNPLKIKFENGDLEGVAVTVGPNPFNDFVRFKISGHSGETAVITLFDRSGKVVGYKSGKLENGRDQIEWSGFEDMRLPAGVYLYKVEVGSDVYNGKVISQ